MSTGSVVAGSSSSDLGRQSGDSGPSNKWNGQPTVSTMAVSPPKAARAPANGSHRVSCLVDWCTADLSKCREYHRRHKVCELHFKTPVVMVHRQQQRFCQQCSRFQLVEEFDEVKRSCRRRLAGHNKRRRKPQPCSINPGILFPDHQGFSAHPHIFPTAAAEANWSQMIKTEESTRYNSYRFVRERRQLSFLSQQRDCHRQQIHSPDLCSPDLEHQPESYGATS